MTRVGRVPVDSTSEAEGKATLTGSLVNVYPYGLWMPEEWLGIWGIAGFGTGTSDLTTVGGGIPEESLISWLGAAGQRAELWSGGGLVELGARLDGGDAQRGLGAEAVLASPAGPAQAGDRSSWLPDTVDVTVGYGLDGLELEAFGRHRTGSGDAGYRFGFGGSLEY